MRRFSRPGRLGLCWLTIWLAGCGAGEYQKRMERRIEELRKESTFADLGEPQQWPGTTATLRLPKQFVSVATASGPLAGKLKSPAPLTATEVTAGYYAFVKDENEPSPAYQLLLGSRDASQSRGRNPTQALMNDADSAFPSATELQWQPVECATPKGGTVTWQKLRGETTMEFVMVDAEGALKSTERLVGAMEIYARQEGETVIWMIWRVPKFVEPLVKFAELAQQIGGTLEVQAAAN